jgi:hypothetical protein
MTPEEFAVRVEAYTRRERRDWYRAAWMVCQLLAPYSKTRLTPEKMGITVTRPTPHTPED